MNFAKRRDGPVFLPEQIRGSCVAAFRIAGHGGTIQNLDSSSALFDMAGSG